MKPAATAALLLALAFPAGATAATPPAHRADRAASPQLAHSVVLSVDRRHHELELVGADHIVRAYHYRDPLGRLVVGARVTYHRSGRTVTGIRALHSSGPRTVAYAARVVRSGAHQVRLRLADRRLVAFSAARLSTSSDPVTVRVLGLAPGTQVLVTQTTDAHGHTTVTITLPAAAGGEQHVSGVVAAVGIAGFAITAADGTSLWLHMSPQALDDIALASCDQVTVDYHVDAGVAIADAVHDDGPTATACATGAPTAVATGTITAISPEGLEILSSTGTLAFTADPSAQLTDGFAVGDEVEVSYTRGVATPAAVDIEYVEDEIVGQATSVGADSLTVAGPENAITVGAHPTTDMFDGIEAGDEVDVTYHLSAGTAIADAVTDEGAGPPP